MTLDVVLDTNVLVSGLLSPLGAPAEIIQMIGSRMVIPVYDDRMFAEYERVFRKEKFGFPFEMVEGLFVLLRRIGKPVIPIFTKAKLPDDNDRCFLEAALASASKILITGNKKHFPKSACHNAEILYPRDFLIKYFG